MGRLLLIPFLLIVFVFFAPQTTGAALSGTATINGTILFKGEGSLHIYLVDAETFKVPLSGIRKTEIRPTRAERKSGRVRFRFDDIPRGTYGIRCFLDQNGNGRLDRRRPRLEPPPVAVEAVAAGVVGIDLEALVSARTREGAEQPEQAEVLPRQVQHRRVDVARCGNIGVTEELLHDF